MSEIAIAEVASPPPASPAAWRAWRPTRLLLYFCVAWLVLVVVVAIVTPFLPLESYEQPVAPARTSPTWGDYRTLLGTDAFGRSILVRLMEGARISLFIGAIAVSLAFALGTALGTAAGYFRGWVDAIVRVVLDASLAFPSLILLLAVTAALTPSVTSLSIALALLVTPAFARLARANTLALREEAFVSAARSLGASHLRILVREIVPNVATTLISYSFLMVAVVMVAEGSLSFLGQGIRPPQPTWGGMINDGRSDLGHSPALVFIPAGVMLATIMALNVVGDHLRRTQ